MNGCVSAVKACWKKSSGAENRPRMDAAARRDSFGGAAAMIEPHFSARTRSPPRDFRASYALLVNPSARSRVTRGRVPACQPRTLQKRRHADVAVDEVRQQDRDDNREHFHYSAPFVP